MSEIHLHVGDVLRMPEGHTAFVYLVEYEQAYAYAFTQYRDSMSINLNKTCFTLKLTKDTPFTYLFNERDAQEQQDDTREDGSNS